MATMRDTYGNVMGRSEAESFRNVCGDWVLALIDGSLIDNQINDSYGNKVAEIRGGYICDTSGTRLVEMNGNRIYDMLGTWLFTID